jgi:hypothetical protein
MLTHNQKTNKQNKQTKCKQTSKQTKCKQTSKQTNKQANKQANKQTNKNNIKQNEVKQTKKKQVISLILEKMCKSSVKDTARVIVGSPLLKKLVSSPPPFI